MKLYLVHCGYYDKPLAEGANESHTNVFVVADSFEQARERARALPEFESRSMHESWGD